MRLLAWIGLATLGLLSPGLAAQATECGTGTGNTPLIELTEGTYAGFPGGLYPQGSNQPPEAHLERALASSLRVVPRDAGGAPDDARGLIGMLAIGLSNTAHEFGRFEREADADPERNPRLVLVNTAQAGRSSETMTSSDAEYWELVDERVRAAGLTPAQVQVVWIKQRRAPAYLRSVLKRSGADKPSAVVKRFPERVALLADELEQIVAVLSERFVNLELCYLSDRVFGKYSGAEPKAYEDGFAIKWLIERQIEGSGALSAPTIPTLLWGPYLWADGPNPNALGTRWCRSDCEPEHSGHPSPSGEAKVAGLLASFLAADSSARSWYLRQPDQAPAVVIDASADAHVDPAHPDKPLGAESTLSIGWTEVSGVAYLRFDLSNLERPTLQAKLSFRVPTEAGPSAPCEVHLVAEDHWDEHRLVFDPAADSELARPPALGPPLGTLPDVSRDGTRSLDVTSAVNGHPDDTLTLALVLAGPPAKPAARSRVVAREGGSAPRLVIAPLP